MNITYKKGLFIILVIVLGGFMIWDGYREQESRVVVGGLFNLTGYANFAGEASRDGFLMAIEDWGDPSLFITVIEDARSELKQSVSGALKLIQIDKSQVVIGPEWTEFGEVVSPVAVANKVPFISPWVVAEAHFVKPPYFWSATPSDRSEHAALVGYLVKKDLKRISIVYGNNFWSMINIQMFKEELQRQGGFSIVTEDLLNQTDQDFRTIVTKIKKENPDIIYIAVAEDQDHGAFISQARQLGLSTLIAAHSARAGSAIMKEKYASLMQGQVFAEMVSSERAIEFENKYEKRFKRKPGAPSAAAAYDMTTIVLKAIKEGARTSEEIIEYLNNMEPYEGYSGLIDYDENGRLPLRKAVVKKYNSQGIAEEIK